MAVSTLRCHCSSPPLWKGASGTHHMPISSSLGAARWLFGARMADFGLSWAGGAARASHTAELSAARGPSLRLTLQLTINLK